MAPTFLLFAVGPGEIPPDSLAILQKLAENVPTELLPPKRELHASPQPPHRTLVRSLETIEKPLNTGKMRNPVSFGYAGYHSVASNPDIIHAGCFAHARRKFDEAIKALGAGGRKKPGQVGEALALIGPLYAIEKELREQATPDVRYTTRQLHAKPILDELKIWAAATILAVPPKTALGTALGYLLDHWPLLIRYLDDGRLEIDNNSVENAIRPFVMGRKGWLFSRSVRGVKSSANLYSRIETAKASGLEPFACLRYLFMELPTAQTVDDYEKLLPWNIDLIALSTD
ncbi:MAG: IS66 family transposase [Magnetococcus sp. YQC-3]